MADFPTLADVKAWMKLDPSDTSDDVALTEGMSAAQAHMRTQTVVDDYAGDLPGDLRESFFLRVQRYLARRNSPDGLVGFSDFGPVRVSSFDADIERLEGPHRKVVLA